MLGSCRPTCNYKKWLHALIFLSVAKKKKNPEQKHNGGTRHMTVFCLCCLLFYCAMQYDETLPTCPNFLLRQILGAVTEDRHTHTLLLFATSLPSESICKYHGQTIVLLADEHMLPNNCHCCGMTPETHCLPTIPAQWQHSRKLARTKGIMS